MSWIGFDLDATLAEWGEGTSNEQDINKIGNPIPLMLARLQEHMAAGHECRIVTARVSGPREDPMFVTTQRRMIEEWCEKWIGKKLAITNEKDFQMWILYDDRAKQVIPNTGQLVEDFIINVNQADIH